MKGLRKKRKTSNLGIYLCDFYFSNEKLSVFRFSIHNKSNKEIRVFLSILEYSIIFHIYATK